MKRILNRVVKKQIFVSFLLVASLLVQSLPVVALTTVQTQKIDNILGVYNGSYTATQGITGLTLSIYKTNDLLSDKNLLQTFADVANACGAQAETPTVHTVESIKGIISQHGEDHIALFNYFPMVNENGVGPNPDVEEGLYTMSVSYDETTGKYSFVGKQWIQHDTYVFADLKNISLNDDILEGDVYGEYSSFFWTDYGDIGDVSISRGTSKSGYRIDFENTNASVGLYEKQTIKAVVKNNGETATDDTKIRWFSNDESIAKVAGKNWGDEGFEYVTGEISGVSIGTTQVYAELENKRVAVCTVIVSQNGTISPFQIDTSYELISQIQTTTDGDTKTYAFAPSYKISATIKNPNTKKATNTVVKLNLPQNATLLEESKITRTYTEIKPNEVVEVTWNIVTEGDFYNTTSIEYSVSAESDQCVEIVEFKTLFIDPFEGQDGQIDFSKDVWGFTNSETYFDAGHFINSDHYNALMLNASNIEKENIDGYLNSDWGGSCFGMSVVCALVKQGRLKTSSFGAQYLINASTPKDNDDVYSYITYYHMLQKLDVVSTARIDSLMVPEEQRLKNLYLAVQNVKFTGMPVVLDVWSLKRNYNIYSLNNDNMFSGHTILAYGVETGDYSIQSIVDGSYVQYDKRILLYDPNDNTAPSYMYISDDYSKWMIGDFCQNRTQSDGLYWYKGEGYFDYIGSEEVIDAENIHDSVKNYYSKLVSDWNTRLCIYTESSDGSESEFTASGPNLCGNNADVVPFFNGLSGFGDGDKIGYAFKHLVNLKIVPEGNVGELDLSYEQEDVYYSVQTDTGESVVFAGEDSATLICNGDYVLSAVYNEGAYASPWYSYTVEGDCSGSISFSQDKEGYSIVSGDDLTNVVITAKGHKGTQTLTFTTNEDSVLIKNSGNTIVLFADKDNNGTYETQVAGNVEDESSKQSGLDCLLSSLGVSTTVVFVIVATVGIALVLAGVVFIALAFGGIFLIVRSRKKNKTRDG